jgi:hypothetical protein
MIVTPWVRERLAFLRQERRLLAQGYRMHETDWEIHRGVRRREVILDAKVSTDGKYVYTKLGFRPGTQPDLGNQDRQAMAQDPNALQLGFAPRSDGFDHGR